MKKSFYKKVKGKDLLIELLLEASQDDDEITIELVEIERVYDEEELEDVVVDEDIEEIVYDWIDRNHKKLVKEIKNVEYD